MKLADDVVPDHLTVAKDDLSGADIKALYTKASLVTLRGHRMKTLSWPEQWLGLYSPYLWVWKEDRSVRSRIRAAKAVSVPVLALSCSQKGRAGQVFFWQGSLFPALKEFQQDKESSFHGDVHHREILEMK
eukprot:bmy_09953T0